MARVLKLLGDSTRLSIMQYVSKGECCVCELVELLDMSQPAISQHLRKLRDANLVVENRKRKWIFYRINEHHVAYELIHQLLEELPSVDDEFEELDRKNLRIICD
nr:metalloregulator ArsR/SmtB family transcription factor [Alkalibacillus aidingensis]